MSSDGGGGPQGDVGPTGTLDAVVIHKDGSETQEGPKQSLLSKLFGWLKPKGQS